MTKSALNYARAVVAMGVAILISAAWLWRSANGIAFGVCLALALFASTLKLKLTGLTGTLSPGFVFLLVSVAMLSWQETVIIAVAAGLVQCLWRPKVPPSSLQIGFAGATMAISAGLTHGVTWGLVAMRSADGMVVILGVAGVVLLVTNTLLVSTILCLLREAPFETVWRSVQRRAVPYYLAGGLLAGVWVRADLATTAGMAVLAAISVYLLSICCRELDMHIASPG